MAVITNRILPRMGLSSDPKRQVAVQIGAELQVSDIANKLTNLAGYERDNRLLLTYE